jgi:putative membrane protein
MQQLIHLAVSALAVIITAFLLPGVQVGILSAFLAALVLGLLNTFVKPLMILFTLPVNVLTLGLFTFVINAVIILLASSIVPGFKVKGFWWALLFSLILSLVSYFLERYFIK